MECCAYWSACVTWALGAETTPNPILDITQYVDSHMGPNQNKAHDIGLLVLSTQASTIWAPPTKLLAEISP